MGIVPSSASGRPGNRHQLTEDLTKRLGAAIESEDPQRLLDSSLLYLARDLAQTVPQEIEEAAATPDIVEALDVLALLHWIRYEVLPEGRDEDDLQTSLEWYGALLQIAPSLVPEFVRDELAAAGMPADSSAAESTNHGAELLEDYQRTGDGQLLQTAISLFRDAVGSTPASDPNRPAMLTNLGGALQELFERTGQLRDLDEAIAVSSAAVSTAPSGHPDRPGYLSNLGAALQRRFGCTGNLQDLDEAITVFREAAGSTQASDPERPEYLSNLGGALQTRFGRTAQPEDLEEAVTSSREAVQATSRTEDSAGRGACPSSEPHCISGWGWPGNPRI